MARRLALIAVTAAALLAAPPAGATIVGIGDQNASSFADPLFKPLSVGHSRVVVPWNAVHLQTDRLDAWVDGSNDAGIEPIIAFGHAATDACPNAPCTLPSVDQYREAFLDFRARYPWVLTFTPWNEPNHGSQPTAGNPVAAARFYNALVEACPECTVTAGDVLDGPGFMDWLRTYRTGLASEPAVWALHNYYDTTYFRMTGVQALLAEVPGQVWLTETGGIVTWNTADGRVALPYDEARAAASVSYTFDIARAYPDRVTRVYLYQWRAGLDDGFDAGIERPDGTPRPSLDVIRGQIVPLQPEQAGLLGEERGEMSGVSAGIGPKPFTDAAGALLRSARILTRRVRIGRDGRVRVPVACERAPCRGAVTLQGRGWAAASYVNGRAERGRLTARRRTFGVEKEGTVTVIFRLRGALLTRARRHRSLPAGLTLVPDQPLEGWAANLRLRLRFGR